MSKEKTTDVREFNFSYLSNRLLAFVIDALVLAMFYRIFIVPATNWIHFDLLIPSKHSNHLEDAIFSTFYSNIFHNLLMLVIGWIYFSYSETSKYQATWGKRLVGIKVTSTDGNALSFPQASKRHFAKFLSAIILFVGYLMPIFSDKKQALHDRLSNSLVVNE